MAEVLFFIAGTGAIAGAIGVVSMRNPFYSVLSLVFHLLSLAALFLLLRAEFVAAAQVVAFAGAIGVISMRNPFYSVLSLVFHLLSLAALFLLLRAEFVAAAQVVVYAGAVMVLYVFVVAYIGGRDRPVRPGGAGLVPLASLFAAVLLVELMIAMLGSGLQVIGSEGAPFDPRFGSTGQIGELFLTKFLLGFEVASYLLLVAAVGAVILARRRRGLPGEERPQFFEVPLPPGTGTMAETVAAIPAGYARREAIDRPDPGGW